MPQYGVWSWPPPSQASNGGNETLRAAALNIARYHGVASPPPATQKAALWDRSHAMPANAARKISSVARIQRHRERRDATISRRRFLVTRRLATAMIPQQRSIESRPNGSGVVLDSAHASQMTSMIPSAF